MFDTITSDLRARAQSSVEGLADHLTARQHWRRDLVGLVLIVVVGVALLAFTWFKASQANTVETEAVAIDAGSGSPESGLSATSTTLDQIRVHVVGAVARPGVYALKAGSRGVDAIEAAGGLAPNADVARVNLAAEIADGEQVYIPVLGEVGLGATEPSGPGASHGAGGAQSGGQVNINTADVAELDTLPGVGETTARKIIDYRERNGRFKSIQDLLEVPGIGERKFADLEKLIRV